MIGRLNHVAIAVRDIEAASKVYRDTLGADVSSCVPLPERRARNQLFYCSNSQPLAWKSRSRPLQQGDEVVAKRGARKIIEHRKAQQVTTLAAASLRNKDSRGCNPRYRLPWQCSAS